MTITCLLAYINTISSDEKKRIIGLCIIIKNNPKLNVIRPEHNGTLQCPSLILEYFLAP